MSSLDTPTHAAPALALIPVAPLDGECGYLRWKESVLLRLRALGMAYALFEKRPAGETVEAAEKWARDDALCRGYILAALSDRLLPVYAHHSTARALWRAVARTHDLDMSSVSREKFSEFQFVEGEPVLEQLALVQALATGAKVKDQLLSRLLLKKLPLDLAEFVARDHWPPCMDDIWKTARMKVVLDMSEEIHRSQHTQQTTDEQGSSSSDNHRGTKRRRQT